MVKIEIATKIKENREKVYNFVKNMENFPKFMRYIHSLKVTKSSSSKFISDWNVNIDGVPVKWKEEDVFDDKHFIIDFKALEGDYSRYEGQWKFIEKSFKDTEIKLSLDVDFGAPAFTKFPEVKKILNRKTKKAFKGMFLAIKNKLDKK